ncbi:cupin domain-containing protein [Spirosoma validum]|uniref:Uncharacterized protein n=1 Tax=Spirosoma validum TaxID=2771355 RepID=A0A927GG83_9BACT|nr:hypothetical protein [Spirosoma validum]MBD2756727.1 hypothetical protein [Spirosoma validum]
MKIAETRLILLVALRRVFGVICCQGTSQGRRDQMRLPGMEYWHETLADKQTTHVAINANTEKGVVTWLKRVTDEEYNQLT